MRKYFVRISMICVAGVAVGQLIAQDSNPVSIDVSVVADQDQDLKYDLIVEMSIREGWHAYEKVPSGNPAVATQVELALPDGVKTVGDWERPVGLPDNKDPRASVLHGIAQFTRTIQAIPSDRELEIGVQVNYQVCNEQACLPPEVFTTNVALPATRTAKEETDDDTKFVNQYFEAPIRLMVGDEPLNTQAAQMYPSPAVFDVDNDGQVELIVGDIFGGLNIYENENEGEGDPVWSSHEPLKSGDGEPIKVSNW